MGWAELFLPMVLLLEINEPGLDNIAHYTAVTIGVAAGLALKPIREERE
jgi:hypothetical protein